MNRGTRILCAIVLTIITTALALLALSLMDHGRRCPTTLPGASAYDMPHRCSR